MTDRLVTEWTETLEECYGEKGKLGLKGELIALHHIQEMGLKVTHHPDNRELQLLGIDLVIHGTKSKYGVDVKANLHQGQSVPIEWRKIMETRARFWMHVDVDHPDDFVIYRVKAMRKYLLQQGHCAPLMYVERAFANTLR